MVKINWRDWARSRVPMLVWLPAYTPGDALSDLVAGLTVGLTLIPQAIAYAALAGLAPQFGLYSAFVGSLVYIALGTCQEINIGPTALISLLTFTYARGDKYYTVLLCFLSGCVTFIMGILHLGFLVELVSAPVVSGFTSAASLIIACSQIKGLLGVKAEGEGFIQIWEGLFEHLNATRMPDFILSCCCIMFLLVMKTVKDIKTQNAVVTKMLWYLGTARNAIVVITCAVVAYVFEMNSSKPFTLTGHIDAGLPPVGLPPFSFRSAGNETVGFLEMCTKLGSGIIVVPLVSTIGNVAIGKAFSHGKTMDATQEMLTLGLCNIAGSFFSSMPVTGSFSRSAVNNASGVKTPMGGLYTGILVILSLSLLTPYFYYIPKATLSSVIICAVIFMMEPGTVKSIWKCNRLGIIPALVTFLACLFAGVEVGILIGVAIDTAILIYYNARPVMDIEYRNQPGRSYVLVRPAGGILFPAVDHLRKHLTECLTAKRKRNVMNDQLLPNVVLDCRHIHRIDFTASQGIIATIADLEAQDCFLILLHTKQEISKSIQSLTEKPILTAHSEMELLSILKHHSTGSLNQIDPATAMEIRNLPDLNRRKDDQETTSTNL